MQLIGQDIAKTKVCPFSRMGEDKECIAGECLAWKWAYNVPNGSLLSRKKDDVGYCRNIGD